MPSTPFQTTLDQELIDRARAKATSQGKTLEQIASELIKDWVGTWQPSPQSAPPLPPPETTAKLPLPPSTSPTPTTAPIIAPPVSTTPPVSSAPPVVVLPAPVPSPAPAPTPPAIPEPRTHLVKSGDSLWKLAAYYYGDGDMYMLIARANDVHAERRLQPGMRLIIPPVPDPASRGMGFLPAPNVAPKPGYPIVPDGLSRVKEVFGRFSYTEIRGKPVGRVQINAQWLANNIIRTQVPALGTIQCHRLLAPVYVALFKELEAQKLTAGLKYYGCFLSRHKMWDPSRDLSVHSWGIAIDLNADTNGVGTAGTMDVRLIKLFAQHGFYWGGNFGDPMHFQYCLNY